jgi:hypothetical protein
VCLETGKKDEENGNGKREIQRLFIDTLTLHLNTNDLPEHVAGLYYTIVEEISTYNEISTYFVTFCALQTSI